MAEQLRADGMEFIDAAGNAFLNQPPLYLFIKGNRPPEPPKQGRTKCGLMMNGCDPRLRRPSGDGEPEVACMG
jgi:hypothetical protein